MLTVSINDLNNLEEALDQCEQMDKFTPIHIGGE